jgi:hypothetical protein
LFPSNFIGNRDIVFGNRKEYQTTEDRRLACKRESCNRGGKRATARVASKDAGFSWNLSRADCDQPTRDPGVPRVGAAFCACSVAGQAGEARHPPRATAVRRRAAMPQACRWRSDAVVRTGFPRVIVASKAPIRSRLAGPSLPNLLSMTRPRPDDPRCDGGISAVPRTKCDVRVVHSIWPLSAIGG